jgi:protein phosphatase
MHDQELRIPAVSLVVLVGASGSGKSTFASTNFEPPEILSSDTCRALVSDDEQDQAASRDAFELLRFIARIRLSRGLLTVIDATNARPEHRAPLVTLARARGIPSVAVVFDFPESVCLEWNRSRPSRTVPERVVRDQIRDLRDGLRTLHDEGFSDVHVLTSAEEVAAVRIVRTDQRGQKKGA